MIVALTGQASCGKGVTSDLLVARGFTKAVLSASLSEKALEKGLDPKDRKVLQNLGDEAREKHGPGILVAWAIQRALDVGGELILLDGLRTVGEVKVLKEMGGILLAIEADPNDVISWCIGRGRQGDPRNEEEYWEMYKRENSGVTDGEMNISKCKELADYTITNSGSIEDLELVLDERLSEIRRRFFGKERE